MSIEHGEFGGAPGLIQPSPHDSSAVAREAAFLERACDPGDELDGPAVVLAKVLNGTYGAYVEPEVPVPGPLEPSVLAVGTTSPSTGVLHFVGVGNSDLRTARLKVSSSRAMFPASYGPEKEITPGLAVVVDINIGGLLPGHYFYQVLMNGLQVTDVAEADVV